MFLAGAPAMTRSRGLLAALSVGVVLGVAAPSSASADGASPDLPQEQIAAIAEAGTVYLSGTWSGYVSYPTSAGSRWSSTIESSFSCSGFVASSDGYVVTAGHCADVAEGKRALVDAFLARQQSDGNLTASDVQYWLHNGAESDWAVEGRSTGTPPTLAMTVYPAISISGSGGAKGYAAILTDDRPLAQGDVALFKIDTPNPLPVLKVSANAPDTGTTVDAVGYPGNVTNLVTADLQPTFAKGQVSGRQQTSGGPFTQIGIAMSPGMSGGPVVNGQADVVGTVSFGPAGDTQQLNFAAAPDTVAAMLARNGVKNTLSTVDRSYRDGLAAYFAGHYRDAAAKLGAVVERDPNNALARQFQVKAMDRFPEEQTIDWTLWAVIGGIAVLVLLVAIGLVLLLIRRRRRGAGVRGGATPAPVAPAFVVTAPAPQAALSEGPSPSPAPVHLGAQHDAVCPNCGEANPHGARFCANCGQAFTSAESQIRDA